MLTAALVRLATAAWTRLPELYLATVVHTSPRTPASVCYSTKAVAVVNVTAHDADPTSSCGSSGARLPISHTRRERLRARRSQRHQMVLCTSSFSHGPLAFLSRRSRWQPVGTPTAPRRTSRELIPLCVLPGVGSAQPCLVRPRVCLGLLLGCQT